MDSASPPYRFGLATLHSESRGHPPGPNVGGKRCPAEAGGAQGEETYKETRPVALVQAAERQGRPWLCRFIIRVAGHAPVLRERAARCPSICSAPGADTPAARWDQAGRNPDRGG
jgi:hypothetical protein